MDARGLRILLRSCTGCYSSVSSQWQTLTRKCADALVAALCSLVASASRNILYPKPQPVAFVCRLSDKKEANQLFRSEATYSWSWKRDCKVALAINPQNRWCRPSTPRVYQHLQRHLVTDDSDFSWHGMACRLLLLDVLFESFFSIAKLLHSALAVYFQRRKREARRIIVAIGILQYWMCVVSLLEVPYPSRVRSQCRCWLSMYAHKRCGAISIFKKIQRSKKYDEKGADLSSQSIIFATLAILAQHWWRLNRQTSQSYSTRQ